MVLTPGRNPYVLAHVPAGLDLEALPAPAAAPYAVERHREYAAWVTSVVAFNRFKSEDPDEPTAVEWEGLAEMVPRGQVTEVVNGLVRAGVLETDGRYTFGHGRRGQARRFVLAERYRHQPLRPVRLTGRPLVMRWEERRRERRADPETEPVRAALEKWVNHLEVVGDPPTGVVPLDHVREGRPWHDVDGYRRYHTPATATGMEHRCRYRLCGSEVDALDVSASHPTLLGLWGANEGRTTQPYVAKSDQRPHNARRHRWSSPTHPTHPSPTHTHTHTATIRGTLTSFCGKPWRTDWPECEWLADARGGTLYQKIAGEVRLDVPAVKEPTLTVVYGGPALLECTPVGKAIKRLYRPFWEALLAEKRKCRCSAQNAYAAACRCWASLPGQMQAWEASIMIWDGAAAELVRDHPSLPFLTVHDAILCRPEDAAVVKGAIQRAWVDHVGVEPKVKPTDWTRELKPAELEDLYKRREDRKEKAERRRKRTGGRRK